MKTSPFCGRSVQEVQHRLDNQIVANSFSAAASQYDQFARLQKQVATTLIDLLPLSSNLLQGVDLGCGTGKMTALLRQRMNNTFEGLTGSSEHLIGIDFAEGMLNHARKHYPSAANAWLCADARALPLPPQSVDWLFSSLALQWCESPQAILQELARVLKPGGCMIFSTLGPKTLWELKETWKRVDSSYTPVNQFFNDQQWRDALAAAGMTLEHSTHELVQLRYPSLKQVMLELKGLGAHTTTINGKPKGLLGKKRWQQLVQTYQQVSAPEHEAECCASYEVFCYVAVV